MKKTLLSLAAFIARAMPGSLRQAIYKIKPLAGWLRKALNRAAPQGLNEVQIAAGALTGYRFLLDMQTEKDYWLGTYEPDLEAVLHTWVPQGAVIYDVGANIGYVAHLLAKAAGDKGKVFAFEALPANVERLRRNVDLNRMGERITVIPAAVMDKAGEVRFLVHASGGMGKAQGSAGRQDEAYQAEVTVPGLSLDEFVFRQGNPLPQVVKMDIEGGEVMALPGMRAVLEQAHPVMLMELHGPESERVAWEVLTSLGYSFHEMKKSPALIASQQALGWKAYVVAAWPKP